MGSCRNGEGIGRLPAGLERSCREPCGEERLTLPDEPEPAALRHRLSRQPRCFVPIRLGEQEAEVDRGEKAPETIGRRSLTGAHQFSEQGFRAVVGTASGGRAGVLVCKIGLQDPARDSRLKQPRFTKVPFGVIVSTGGEQDLGQLRVQMGGLVPPVLLAGARDEAFVEGSRLTKSAGERKEVGPGTSAPYLSVDIATGCRRLHGTAAMMFGAAEIPCPQCDAADGRVDVSVG